MGWLVVVGGADTWGREEGRASMEGTSGMQHIRKDMSRSKGCQQEGSGSEVQIILAGCGAAVVGVGEGLSSNRMHMGRDGQGRQLVDPAQVQSWKDWEGLS